MAAQEDPERNIDLNDIRFRFTAVTAIDRPIFTVLTQWIISGALRRALRRTYHALVWLIKPAALIFSQTASVSHITRPNPARCQPYVRGHTEGIWDS